MYCVECQGELTKVESGFSCPKCGATYTGKSGEVMEELYAFLATDPKTNIEGFVHYQVRPGSMVTAVGTNLEWGEKNFSDFDTMAKRAGMEIRFVKFTGRTVLKTLGGKSGG